MINKRFITFNLYRAHYDSTQNFRVAFENCLNNIPKNYKLHSWQYTPPSESENMSSDGIYVIVFEKVEEIEQLPYGRKFK